MFGMHLKKKVKSDFGGSSNFGGFQSGKRVVSTGPLGLIA